MNRPVMSLAGQLSRRSPAMLSKASSSSSGAFAQPIFARSYATPSSSSPSSSSSTSTPAATTSPNVEGTAQSVVRWDRYLSLRKQKRLAGLVTTVPTTFLAAAGAGSYFLTQEVDPSQAIMGIDPVYVFALATIGCTGFGYLIGPTLGSTIWSMFHRRDMKAFEQKDQDFFDRIKKWRADPSRQTIQNRPPDPYGEKVGSISEYRQWLRDQAAFRRKAAHGVFDDEKQM